MLMDYCDELGDGAIAVGRERGGFECATRRGQGWELLIYSLALVWKLRQVQRGNGRRRCHRRKAEEHIEVDNGLSAITSHEPHGAKEGTICGRIILFHTLRSSRLAYGSAFSTPAGRPAQLY
jgi:hypothetical protein